MACKQSVSRNHKREGITHVHDLIVMGISSSARVSCHMLRIGFEANSEGQLSL